VKASYQRDGFLGTLHLLLLMDDTVILGTSEQAVKDKFGILLEFCQEFGMIVNERKTKFMIIN
jgi:hypothetical protein